MVKAETGRGRGVKVIAAGSALEMVVDVLNIVQAIHGDMSRLSYGERKAEFFRKALIAGLSPDSPVWRPCQGDVTSVVASGDAAELLARGFEGGISMTAIDLTRGQCAALADFLRWTVDRGMDSGYDEIELLVLAQRALRNASKPIGPALVCDVPKSSTPEGGGTVIAVREVAPARPSGASEAARFKRETADRLVAYRSKWGPGCMGRLAALCGGDVNAKGDANMDYTKGCIDRELERIMGSAFQPWEVRYPEKVFGGK